MNFLKVVIPPQIKIALGVAGVVAVLGVAWFINHKIDKGGYDRCVNEHKAAAQEAKDKARGNVVKVEKEYAPKIKELQETPDNDSVVGPLTTCSIDEL